MKNSLSVLCFAEFFGTFLFVSIGLASVAVLVLGLSDLNYPWMAACWGFAVTLAIYVVGGVSGAHMNPAVTLSLAVWGGFNKMNVLPYIIAQVFGAFCAAALVYTCFHEQIIAFEAAKGVVRDAANSGVSAGIFVTAAGSQVSLMTAFLVEAFITCLLVLVIYATTDAKNPAAPVVGLPALAIGAIVIFCGVAFGPLTGFAMNPARDFGPRLFLMIAGWGKTALGSNMYWLLVPISATIIGGQAAGFIYKKIICQGIAAHCPPNAESLTDAA